MNGNRIDQLDLARRFVDPEPEGGTGPVHPHRSAFHSLVASKSPPVTSRVTTRRGQMKIDDFTAQRRRNADRLVDHAEVPAPAGERDVDVLATVPDGEARPGRPQMHDDVGGVLEPVLVVHAEFGGAAGVEPHQRHEAHAVGLVVDRSDRIGQLVVQPVDHPECMDQESTEPDQEHEADDPLDPDVGGGGGDGPRREPDPDRPDGEGGEDENQYEVSFLVHDDLRCGGVGAS